MSTVSQKWPETVAWHFIMVTSYLRHLASIRTEEMAVPHPM